MVRSSLRYFLPSGSLLIIYNNFLSFNLIFDIIKYRHMRRPFDTRGRILAVVGYFQFRGGFYNLLGSDRKI